MSKKPYNPMDPLTFREFMTTPLGIGLGIFFGLKIISIIFW